jgi:hypothetical protein
VAERRASVSGAQPSASRIFRSLWYLGSNRLSVVGVMLTTASAATLLTFFTTSFFGVHLSPYVGIVAFLILPAILLLGLLLIPLGIARRRRREWRAGRLPTQYPPIDLRSSVTREMALFVVVMTGLNVAFFLAATYRGIHLMESVEFCGRTCHTVMQPEHTAYQETAHARVPCVSCHIGPGASWFVRSKLSGSYQVLAVAFDLYPRPIPTPIENLRPSRETCEQCHWPERFVGDRLVVKAHFSEDETPAETKTVLLMRTGGIDPLTGTALGNHGVHVQPGTAIHYLASDERRQEIPYVRYRRPDGEVVEYFAAGRAPTAPVREEDLRLMDCIDCHNRPSHSFELPAAAVDAALSAGRLDRSLPWVKKTALELLRAEHASHDEARAAIRNGFRRFYEERYPAVLAQRRASVDTAADELAAIYTRNVFPAMKVGWGTYPDNIGHEASPGCFRCHDGSHKSATGRVIADDCQTCHAMLAFEDPDPEILRQLSGG